MEWTWQITDFMVVGLKDENVRACTQTHAHTRSCLFNTLVLRIGRPLRPHIQTQSRASESKHTWLWKPLAPRHLLFACLKAHWIILTPSVQQRRTRVGRMMSSGSKGRAAMPTQPVIQQKPDFAGLVLKQDCRETRMKQERWSGCYSGCWSSGFQWR